MGFLGMTKDKNFVFTAAMNMSEGVTEKDEGATQTNIPDDRLIYMRISRDADGCEWAYEHEVAVYRNIKRLCAIMNNGFDVEILKDNDRAIEAQNYILGSIDRLQLRKMINIIITNGSIHGFQVIKKTKKSGVITSLLGLDPKTCNPIRDLTTGELGGDVGKGLNPNNSRMKVALVQKGEVSKYNINGDETSETKTFYFERDDIMPFSFDDRGQFKGISRVLRILRLVEIKKTIENVIELITRRYGPQVWIVVGNENINLTKGNIPQKYLRDSDGNIVDKATALTAYRTALFADIGTKVKKWTTGETLAQIAEYGMDVKVINPSANLPDYVRYIQMIADYIKNGLFGLDFPGRVDVTSSKMLDRIPRDLNDDLELDREVILAILNEELIKPLLKHKGYDLDSVRLKFKPLDKFEIQREVEIERAKSATIYNYMRSGCLDVPKHLKELWGIDVKFKKPEKTEEQRGPKEEKEEEDKDAESRDEASQRKSNTGKDKRI